MAARFKRACCPPTRYSSTGATRTMGALSASPSGCTTRRRHRGRWSHLHAASVVGPRERCGLERRLYEVLRPASRKPCTSGGSGASPPWNQPGKRPSVRSPSWIQRWKSRATGGKPFSARTALNGAVRTRHAGCRAGGPGRPGRALHQRARWRARAETAAMPANMSSQVPGSGTAATGVLPEALVVTEIEPSNVPPV